MLSKITLNSTLLYLIKFVIMFEIEKKTTHSETNNSLKASD